MAGDEQKQTFFLVFRGLVDNGILRLKPAELRLFFALCYFADFDTGKAHPDRETLIKLTGLSKDAFADALKGLRKAGLIRFKRGSKRIGFRYQYEVFCFRPGNLDQSKDDSAFVQETSTKATGQDEILLSSGFEPSALVQETSTIKPLEPLRKEITKERPESSPPLKAGSAPPPLKPKPPLTEEEQKARDKQIEDLERQGIDIPFSLRPKRKP